ncbi:MAG TPA: EF-hand domain-containing protein [Planctomycetaceae bacterium]|jgi:Ca2+-binding EF-hand superfamily protein
MEFLRIAARCTCRGLALRLGCAGLVLLAQIAQQIAQGGEPAEAAADRDNHNLVLLAPAHPVLVQIRVQVDGRGLKSVRTAYAAQLVKLYDKDGDGLLDRDEAKLVPPLVKSPTAREMVAIADRWEAVDRDPADDKVSVDELAAYIDRLFGSPFLLSVKQTGTQSVDLFSLLDRNRDGRLSRDEFETASQILRKLDVDDDETFSIDELQPFRNPQVPQNRPAAVEQSAEQPFLLLDDADSIAQAALQLLQRYGAGTSNSAAAGLSREALGIDAAVFAARDLDGNGLLDKTELPALLTNPTPQLVVEAQLLQLKPGRPKLAVINDALHSVSTDKAKPGKLSVAASGIAVELQVLTNRSDVSHNRTFFITKFTTADTDKNKYISESEFGGIGLPNADFKSVDSNGDGMIVLDELLAYIDQESASSQSRVEFEISHSGKSVFEVIDTNHDRRISRRELTHAFESLRQYDLDGDEAITNVELAGRFKASLQLGKPVMFRNLGGRGGNATMPIANRPTAGPEWFRKMDRNRDGDVSLREFLGPLAAFKKLDTDGDGLISAPEAEKASE